MATDLLHTQNAEMLDVTGLPESLVRDIQRLVVKLREIVTEEELSLRNSQSITQMTDPRGPGVPLFSSHLRHTPEEMERLMDEFSSVPTAKILPPDFSRADMYDDHD